ncbi:MAG TPA: hypothetical protein VN258_16060 [Mobilitalea sp.]|nr:hypothetical protein [Mobilitalea sp.]
MNKEINNNDKNENKPFDFYSRPILPPLKKRKDKYSKLKLKIDNYIKYHL